MSRRYVLINGTFRGREYRAFNNAQFLKIFFHNFSNSKTFTGEEDVMHCNEKDKYSIFNELNSNYKINNKYEFLLIYPFKGLHNWWRQSKLPFDNPEVSGQKAEGYEDVDIMMTDKNWCGLVKTTLDEINVHKTLTYIDGSAGIWWWHYSIGTYNKLISNTGETKEVFLYIRVPLFNQALLLTRSCYKQRFSYHISLIILLIS